MIPLQASKLYIVEGIEEDPRMRARARRLQTDIHAKSIEYVGDEELNQAFASGELSSTRCGMNAEIEPVVIFNRFRFDDPPEVQERRREEFPHLFKKTKLAGYGGFDWRDSGSAAYRERTGLVCQPAWQLHTIVGCHYRCAYCSLNNPVIILMNVEEFVDRLDEDIGKVSGQTLYQYDNYTDTVCFEPEYGGSRLLIEYFARRTGEHLELYVGKSDHVEHLLDLDHRGHTVCCWSLSGRTQTAAFEHRAASPGDRIEAARKSQEAGYPVRFRFSPIIPVRNWQDENRKMIEELFALSLTDAIQAAAKIGFPAIELACTKPHFDVKTAREDPGNVAERVHRAGLDISALSLFTTFTDRSGLDAQIEETETYIRLAPLFHAQIVKMTPGPPASAKATKDHWRNLAVALDRLVPVAEATGVRLAFETHMRQLTDTLVGSMRLLEMAPSDTVGLTVDFSNLTFAGEKMPEAIHALKDRIYNTHVKNGTIGEDGVWHFHALDTGLTNYSDVFSLLREIHYTGYLTIECLGPDARERPVETAKRDLEILRRYLGEYPTSNTQCSMSK